MDKGGEGEIYKASYDFYSVVKGKGFWLSASYLSLLSWG